jgi:hypothetical protein
MTINIDYYLNGCYVRKEKLFFYVESFQEVTNIIFIKKLMDRKFFRWSRINIGSHIGLICEKKDGTHLVAAILRGIDGIDGLPEFNYKECHQRKNEYNRRKEEIRVVK